MLKPLISNRSRIASFVSVAAVSVSWLQAAPHAALISQDKGYGPSELAAIKARGEPLRYSADQLNYLGLPIGGIGAGQLYLSGEGKLWYWGLFAEEDIWSKCEGMRYEFPSDPADFTPLEQGFGVRWKLEGAASAEYRPLDRSGFPELEFLPQSPRAVVRYSDAQVPFDVELTAWTPYTPLDLQHSTYPAVMLDFVVTNTASSTLQLDLLGWLENYVGHSFRDLVEGERVNRLVSGEFGDALKLGIDVADFSMPKADRNVVLLADFEQGAEAWEAEGEAFAPAAGKPVITKGVLDSRRLGDDATGVIRSPAFIIDRKFLNFKLGGGRWPQADGIGMRLIVDGETVRREAGFRKPRLTERSWNVSGFMGRSAVLEVYDHRVGREGNVVVDDIELADTPRVMPDDFSGAGDVGAMALSLMGGASDGLVALDLQAAPGLGTMGRTEAESRVPLSAESIGMLGRRVELAPGEQARFSFSLAWYFPYQGGPKFKKAYGVRFDDVEAVLTEVAGNYDLLRAQSDLWIETWQDSSLPHWLLERIFIPGNAMQTNTIQHLDNKKRWNMLEGSSSLGGNCTHVYHYAQSMARLFPEIERYARENIELGIGFTPKGEIKFRSVAGNKFMTAMDGSTGTILRVLREHQMSPDDAFLQRVWPDTKKAMQYLMKQYDPDENGITDGFQHHTLDQEWAGRIPWLSSMYLAAVSACERMSTIVGDADFAAHCQAIVTAGAKNLPKATWNEDYGYYVMKKDPELKRPSAGTYSGVHIDQVLGEFWLGQVGLDPILPEAQVKSALDAIYRYNFTPDVGPYREVFENGRFYALPGEPGLLMTTFPYGDAEFGKGRGYADGYLNECMTGFEWAAATNMIRAGLLDQGLAVIHAIDRRYAPELRNPFNEIECGDHYARAMASMGAYIELLGYRYDGPAGVLGFDPQLNADDFRAAFTAAEGWGSFSQQRSAGKQVNSIELKWGSLRLQTLELGLAQMPSGAPIVQVNGKTLLARAELVEGKLQLHFDSELRLQAGDQLTTTQAVR